MSLTFHLRIIVLFILMGALLAGCTASKPTSFYVLTEKAPKNGTAVQDRQNACPGVELGRVSIPEYLDATSIMTRVGPNRLRLSELHQWAEPLKESFARILAGNLDSRLCDEDSGVVSRDAGSGKEYRLRVNVFRFEPLQRKRVLLRARWTVFNTQKRETVCTRDSSYEHSIAGAEHQHVAAAMSKAVASLSGDIAECLLRVAAKDGDG
jgi:uncharacterized lipoprotein YmbA